MTSQEVAQDVAYEAEQRKKRNKLSGQLKKFNKRLQAAADSKDAPKVRTLFADLKAHIQELGVSGVKCSIPVASKCADYVSAILSPEEWQPWFSFTESDMLSFREAALPIYRFVHAKNMNEKLQAWVALYLAIQELCVLLSYKENRKKKVLFEAIFHSEKEKSQIYSILLRIIRQVTFRRPELEALIPKDRFLFLPIEVN